MCLPLPTPRSTHTLTLDPHQSPTLSSQAVTGMHKILTEMQLIPLLLKLGCFLCAQPMQAAQQTSHACIWPPKDPKTLATSSQSLSRTKLNRCHLGTQYV